MPLKKRDKQERSGCGLGLWRRTFRLFGSEEQSMSQPPNGRLYMSPSPSLPIPHGDVSYLEERFAHRFIQQNNSSEPTPHPRVEDYGWRPPRPETYWRPPDAYRPNVSQPNLPYQTFGGLGPGQSTASSVSPQDYAEPYPDHRLHYGRHGSPQRRYQAPGFQPNGSTTSLGYQRLRVSDSQGPQGNLQHPRLRPGYDPTLPLYPWADDECQLQGPGIRQKPLAAPKPSPRMASMPLVRRKKVASSAAIPRSLQRRSIAMDMPANDIFLIEHQTVTGSPSPTDGSPVEAFPRRRTPDLSVDQLFNIDLLETDEELLRINLNQHFSHTSEPPAWYIQDPEEVPRGDPKHLCGTCRHIDLNFLYGLRGTDEAPHPRELIQLGTLADFLLKFRDCGLCHFLMRLIAAEITTIKRGPGFTIDDMVDEFFGRYLDRPGSQETDYFLYPIQFKGESNLPGLYICRGPLPEIDSEDTKSLVRPNHLLGFRRVHNCCRAPNTGRSIEARDTIDIEWIKEKLKLCEERSVGRGVYSSPVKIRVIDVHQMCIVDLEDGEEYVTLSYVWGEAKQVRLVRETELLLRMPQGVAAFWDRIPNTIRDAINLTRQIGLHYLWVDALCIIQDDKEDQARQIKQMGRIYEDCILTIQARCGNDASYGLPGVEPGTRNVNQLLGFAGKGTLCNILPDNEFVPSVWETRAWTMQENVLSQRKLIITDQSCTYWCRHTSTSEDLHCRHGYWPVGEKHKGMLFYKANHGSLVKYVRRKSNFDMYAFMVSDYTQRNMKNQADAENAMLGILDAIAGLFNGRYLHGLPNSEIDSALLWCPTGHSERRVDERTGKPLFPSWSWLGWIGHACFPWATERSLPLTSKASPMKWRVDCHGDETEVPEKEWESRVDAFSGVWVRLEDDPWCWSSQEKVFWNPLSDFRIGFTRFSDHPHRLEMQTWTASFRLSAESVRREENYNFQHEIYHMHILDASGFRIGAISTPKPGAFTSAQKAAFQGQDRRHDFIALSRASIHKDPRVGLDELEEEELDSDWPSPLIRLTPSRIRNTYGLDPNATQAVHRLGMFDMAKYDEKVPYCMFNVLMIEWDNFRDVASRIAVGRIHIDAFLAASPILKDVCLE